MADLGEAPDYDAIIIGAGMSGLYQLYRLRELGMRGARVRGRHRRRRHLVLEPLSRRALRFRKLFLQLLVLAGTAGGMGLVASISPASRRRCAISTMSPTSSTCAATSSSAAAWPRRTIRRRRARWDVTLEDGSRHSARFLITAIGPLSAPTMPRIEGVETFQGQSFHTARWPHEPVQLRGQAGGGDRHRRHRRADDPGSGEDRRPPDRVPAHAELVRAAAQQQDQRRGDGADQGGLSGDVQALPGNLRLLPAHARSARHVRGDAGGARGVLGEAATPSLASASGRAISATS